jgi:hypothetical protein
MSSQQKRGFRLPWASERDSVDGAGAATVDEEQGPAARLDLLQGEGGDALGDGPFHFTDAPTPDASTDAAPEAPDVPETTGEATMIDTENTTTEPAEAPETDHEAWPTTDKRQKAVAAAASEAAAPPPIRVEGERAVRTNPLVAGLVKAMREAALASRAETTARLQAEVAARVEAIRESGTARAADLRKRADEDIAGIREWSKAEIARLRQETDERVESRKTDLTSQTAQHEAAIEREAEQVQSTVASFEADMDEFFERLLAENDPARLAALAEQAPDPPDLSAEVVAANGEVVGQDTAAGVGEWKDVNWTPAGLKADAAAEAEAAATEGLDLSANEEWPVAVQAAALRAESPDDDFEAAGVANTRLFVNGLSSVAGISAFKGALGQLQGVSSVSVSSGEPGVFIFTVVHSPDADLQSGVGELTSFSALVTDASEDGLTVTAHEQDA